MHRVKNLYAVWSDDDGHKYLILKDDYGAFEKQLERIEYAFNEHHDSDVYYKQLDDLLDWFSKGQLEGEDHFIVLKDDVVNKDELEVE